MRGGERRHALVHPAAAEGVQLFTVNLFDDSAAFAAGGSQPAHCRCAFPGEHIQRVDRAVGAQRLRYGVSPDDEILIFRIPRHSPPLSRLCGT